MSWGYPGDDEDRRGPAQKRHATIKSRPIGNIVSTYDYTDENGTLLFQVVRDDKKDFYPRRPNVGRDPKEPEWLYGLGTARRVLYRLPEVAAAVGLGLPIYVVEGEKDADALASIGLTATTNPGGVGMGWTKLHTALVSGAASVIVLPDNDEHGIKHARSVRNTLRDKVGNVRILRLPGLPEKGDVSDWIASGGTREKLEWLVTNPPTPEGWISAGDLADRPMENVTWIIPNILSKPSLAILSGESGVWKSWLGTDLAIGAAVHGRFMDHFPIENAERVMLVTADEDAGEARRKIKFIAAGARLNGTSEAALKRNFLLWIDDLDFSDDDQFATLEEDVADFRPDIIIVDHIRVCFAGKENDSEFARAVKRRAKALQTAHPCCVLWYHHWNKPSKEGGKRAGDRLRGTGGLRGIADHHLAVERSIEGVGTFIVDKNRKGPEPPAMCFIPRIVESEGLATIEYQGDAEDRTANTGATKAVLELVRTNCTKAWPRPEVDRELRDHFTPRQIHTAIDRLERARLVTVEPSSGRKPVTIVARDAPMPYQE